MWLPVTAGDKIGTGSISVNAHQTGHPPARTGSRDRQETNMSLTLLAAIASLIGWVVLVFFSRLNAGAIHLLLALGSTLLVRWWALRA